MERSVVLDGHTKSGKASSLLNRKLTRLARPMKSPKGWKRPFDDPVPLLRGRQLVTLQDAAEYIMKLPKAEQNLEEWQAATEALIQWRRKIGGR
jgi:hypothetical protein